MTQTAITARPSQRGRTKSAAEAGLPDPRPVTDYSVAVSTVSGNTRLTITLAQPCVVRTPVWRVIACDTGAATTLPTPTIVSNTQFYYTVTGALNPAVGFIDVPYQDTQVQNPQGGYVRPGAQWFRAPVTP